MKPIRVQPSQNESKLIQFPPENSKSIKNQPCDQNIYRSLKFFFVVSRVLCTLPQENLFSKPTDMKFSWKSWISGASAFFIALHSVSVACCLLQIFIEGFSMVYLEALLYYASTALSLILYMCLAQSNWSKLIIKWCSLDKIMNKNYGYPKILNRKLWTVSLAFGILSTIDFLLAILSRYFKEARIYQSSYSTKHFFTANFPDVFKYLPYVDVLSGVYCVTVAAHGGLLWGFNDLFIILLSIALALKFNQILIRICDEKDKEKPSHYWTEIREDFDRLSLLCREVDSSISFIILLSYGVNTCFLLIQLFHSLDIPIGTLHPLVFRSTSTAVGKIYFAYSFLYLLIKITSVSLYAAWINDECIDIANILNSIPSASYNTEIRRLLQQITFENVALTGCKMFKITRGLILNLASAVVTYELVLIQFNQASQAYEGY